MTRETFERFYRETLPRLESFIARTCGSRELAEELVQEAYYRFLRSEFRGADDEERRRYLYRIAVNVTKSHWRKREEIVEIEVAAPRETLDVTRTLARMSPRDRALLWFAYAEEYSHREIAGILGVGAMSVRVLLSRAKKRFVKMMEGR